jgi:hypothetical protein
MLIDRANVQEWRQPWKFILLRKGYRKMGGFLTTSLGVMAYFRVVIFFSLSSQLVKDS